MTDKHATKVLVTGAGGFIGSVLCHKLTSAGYAVVPVVRRNSGNPEEVVLDEIGPQTDWYEYLVGCHVVVHTAARVHVMREKADNPIEEFRSVNVSGTLNLAKQASEAGVRRFVYLSSIKVNGENGVFNDTSIALPQDDYAVSKLEAERGLMALANNTGMDVVVIRPPLVYGPGVKANFLSMMTWLYKGIPLPFGAIHNKRSLVGLDNLIDLIITCIDHPAAANQVFLVSDGEDLSTTELLQRTAAALGKKARLLKIPQPALELVLKMLGKGSLVQRLCGSLQVDIGQTRELLGWSPPVSVDEGLSRTASAFKLSLNK